jgi:hypothetical protein
MKPLAAVMAIVVCLIVGTTSFQTAPSGIGSDHVRDTEGPAVAVVGDSLAWQAAASIEATFSSARIPVHVSVNPGHALSSPWAQSTLDVDEKEGKYKVTVLETASNDAALVERDIVPVSRYSQLLDQLVTASDGRCLVIMNAKVDVDSMYYQPSAALAVNQVIQETAVQHPNVRVVNWNGIAQVHRSWFWGDMLHLSPGLPAKVLADSPPKATAQSAADREFALALTKGIDSCPDDRSGSIQPGLSPDPPDRGVAPIALLQSPFGR